MLVLKTGSPDETYLLGKHIAELLQPGDVLCLSGSLGAGKTLLSQGIAAGLQVTEHVASPTFTVLNVYEGVAGNNRPVAIYHFDLYRLEHPAELEDIGFSHYTDAGEVAIIEWPERFLEYLPAERLWLTLKPGEQPNERLVCFKAEGSRYLELCEEMKQIADSRY